MNNPPDPSHQLVIEDRPYAIWFLSVVLIMTAGFVYLTSHSIFMMILFVSIGLLLTIFFASVNTINADRVHHILTIHSRSFIQASSESYPFDEIAGFEVENSMRRSGRRSNNSTYRLVLVKTSGERIPLRGFYTSGYNGKGRNAQALNDYLNLPGREENPTNMFGLPFHSQAGINPDPTLSKEGITSGVTWRIETHGVGERLVTRWISTDFTCPGNFLLVMQMPKEIPIKVGGEGLVNNFILLIYKKFLGLYGFLPGDTPGFDSAETVKINNERFTKTYYTLTSEQTFGQSTLNDWTVIPLKNWADRHPMQNVSADEQVGQLAVMYSPRGLQAAILGNPSDEILDDLIWLGVELVKAQV